MKHGSKRESEVPASRVRQFFALAVGIAFVAAGILGVVPWATTGASELSAAGPHSETYLFGIFAVSILHNVLHLAFGVAGIVLAMRAIGARIYLVGGGIAYLALTVYGLVIDLDSEANVIPPNQADNWLHLGVGLALVVLGLVPLRGPR
ncbi:DUF4383 domain-containing protein [Hoyosella sp. G463]|uniref:DUF4383 domain-containing protein n=1 Tax=Lolliginicoccus lacisalsi TaxID=2742202 RepID=A0A927PKW0_9ACTN|nr:DUF4383 domain-containing protein [Lolliginicoccus lacisalsi]MBD8506465.1 DUF4383 domain-containing protein [Lolliginicoccus lacisalsi]